MKTCIDGAGSTKTPAPDHECMHIYYIAGFFKEKNFHEFYESFVICEKFTLKIFTLGINKMALFKYFKVDKCVKEDNSISNSNAVLPSSSGSLTQAMLFSRIDAINDNIKAVVEIIMDTGMTTWDMYEKARVAKGTAKYGVLCIVWHCAKTWLDSPLTERTVWGWRVGTIAKF